MGNNKENLSTSDAAKKYNITLDPTTQDEKPSKLQMGIISDNMIMVTGLTLNEFSTYLTPPYIYTWSGSIFEGTRSNISWREQSVFALDFDKGKISVDEVIRKLKERNIETQLWYTTLGSTESLHKFRVVIILDESVTHLHDRETIVRGLHTLFPEADQSCKDASRIFLGGKSATILSTVPNKKQEVLDRIGIFVVSSDRMKVRHIHTDPLLQASRNGEKWNSLYNTYRNDQISPNSIKYGTRIDWDSARSKIKILDKFLNGDWLYHNQLFGLATNMIHIRGGEKLMKETMLKYNQLGLTHYSDEKLAIIPYVKKKGYNPEKVKNFSPCIEDKNLSDIISTVNVTRGHVEILTPTRKKSKEEAESFLADTFEEIMDKDGDTDIHIIKVPTALGKTHHLLYYNGTIASPTHKLKLELSSRMSSTHLMTPDELIFENMNINRCIESYFTMGLYSKANALIHAVAKGSSLFEVSIQDRAKAINHLESIQQCYYSTDTILTTHSRALMCDFLHDTIIFDEDPLDQLLQIKQLSISELQRIRNQKGYFKSDIDTIIDYFENCPSGEILQSPQLDIDVDRLIEQISLATSYQSNIFDFFSSSFLIRDKNDGDLINYVVKRNLPQNKKIVILSATIPHYVYTQLFGKRVKIYDIGLVEQQGKIIQYTNRSCSRSQLNKYVSSVSEQVGDKITITFNEYQHHFKNPEKNVYFGNCSGYDHLKGKDLAVVGTPHRNNAQYLLTAKCMGMEFKTSDTTFSYQPVEYNGMKFNFNAYDHEGLRNIQLSLIESDLTQAVGRARTLRTDATVELYSNFPLSISTTLVF
jgi:hypothetical protein